MNFFPESLSRLVSELTRMPTVGPRTAQRLAFYLLNCPREDVERLAQAMRDVRERIRRCEICFNLSESPRCAICEDPHRDRTVVCVVADFRDVSAVDRSGAFKGLYHVLGGLISPVDGVGPEDLSIEALQQRVGREGIEEVILATDPTVPGETTALYLARLLAGRVPRVTRLATGLPQGADLDYADEVTISRSLSGRRPV
ncbi:MAG TPA: recombination mediator RecR [Candidatus Xenobia bacterium]